MICKVFKIFLDILISMALLTSCMSTRKATSTLKSTVSPIPVENTPTATETIQTRTTEFSNTPTPYIAPTSSPTPQKNDIGIGIELAYEQNGKIWLWRNGKSTNLTTVTGNKMIWMSDDGYYVAYNSDLDELGFFDLWVSDLQGNVRQILSATILSTMASAGLGLEWPQIQVEWIPGTHKLLLNDYKDGRLYIIDAETGEYKKIVQFPQPGIINISPNGATAVLFGRDSFYKFDLTNFKLSNLSNLFQAYMIKEISNNPKITWLDESQRVRIAFATTVQSAGVQAFEIVDIDLLNSKITPLFSIEVFSSIIELSPKGLWVVYGKNVNESSDQKVVLRAINLEDGIDNEIMSDPEFFLGWSVDEKKIAVRSRTENGVVDKIFLLDPEVSAIDLPRTSKFITWLDSNRYLNSLGEIRNVLSGEKISVINNYQFNPFDFIVTRK